jgi:hypothetical protein
MPNFYPWMWIVYFLAAYYLRHRSNRPLVLGLVGNGITSLHLAALQFDLIGPEVWRDTSTIFGVMDLISTGLLLMGIVMLAGSFASGRTGRSSPAVLDASGENLSTLFIPRNETNTYSRGETLRDSASERLAARAARDGIDTVVQKSNAHSPDVWFRLDYLLSHADPNLSLRAHVEVVVERLDFHRYENLFSVTARVGVQSRRVTGVIEIDDEAVERIHRFIVQPGSRLRLPNRVRQFPLQLWRPRNKVNRLRTDWVPLLWMAGAFALLVVPLLGPFLTMGFAAWFYFWNRRRRTYVLTSGRPRSDPRSLQWMDSWQATILGLGERAIVVEQAIMERLRSNAPADLSVGIERIGYWGVDSRVERDQIAIRYRHALGFVQIVAHGENLYVSWECHLNFAAWTEETLRKGVDRSTGLLVHANRVMSGSKYINEYDVADSNFLGEWMHEAVKRELRLKLAEHQIDQDIDFTVQRESRKEALDRDKASAAPEKKTVLNRIRRVA